MDSKEQWEEIYYTYKTAEENITLTEDYGVPTSVLIKKQFGPPKHHEN